MGLVELKEGDLEDGFEGARDPSRRGVILACIGRVGDKRERKRDIDGKLIRHFESRVSFVAPNVQPVPDRHGQRSM